MRLLKPTQTKLMYKKQELKEKKKKLFQFKNERKKPMRFKCKTGKTKCTHTHNS